MFTDNSIAYCRTWRSHSSGLLNSKSLSILPVSSLNVLCIWHIYTNCFCWLLNSYVYLFISVFKSSSSKLLETWGWHLSKIRFCPFVSGLWPCSVAPVLCSPSYFLESTLSFCIMWPKYISAWFSSFICRLLPAESILGSWKLIL